MSQPLQSQNPLASLFLPLPAGPAVPLRYRTGRVTAWDPATGANVVEVDGVSIENLPVMPGRHLDFISAGTRVSLLSTSDDKGISTYIVAGLAIAPPDVRLARDDIRAAAERPAQAWTPSFEGTAAAIGNGQLYGLYKPFGTGADVTVRLIVGSTTDFGAGSVAFGNLPVSPRVPIDIWSGYGYAYDAGPGEGYSISGLVEGGPAIRPVCATGNVTATVPFTFGPDDQIVLTLRCEVA